MVNSGRGEWFIAVTCHNILCHKYYVTIYVSPNRPDPHLHSVPLLSGTIPTNRTLHKHSLFSLTIFPDHTLLITTQIYSNVISKLKYVP